MDILKKLLNTTIDNNADALMLIRLVSADIELSFGQSIGSIHSIRMAMPKGYKIDRGINTIYARGKFRGLELPLIDNENRRALYALVLAWRLYKTDMAKERYCLPCDRMGLKFDGII